MTSTTDRTPSFLPQRPLRARIAVTLGMFVLGPAVGLSLAWLVAPGKIMVQAVGLFAPAATMIFGYKLWLARATAILLGGTIRKLKAGLWRLAIRRERVDVAEVLPDRERLAELAVRAAAACSTFRTVAIVVALPAAAVAALAAPHGRAIAAGLVFAVAVAAYGAALTRLARSGYVTLPEED